MTAAALDRIAAALERLAPPPVPVPDFTDAQAYVWQPDPDRLVPVTRVARVGLDQLLGIDRARDTLLQNTLQFARGFGANNALLWGARGMGKSSLVNALLGTACCPVDDDIATAVPTVLRWSEQWAAAVHLPCCWDHTD